jgi:hypothetical protein
VLVFLYSSPLPSLSFQQAKQASFLPSNLNADGSVKIGACGNLPLSVLTFCSVLARFISLQFCGYFFLPPVASQLSAAEARMQATVSAKTSKW